MALRVPTLPRWKVSVSTPEKETEITRQAERQDGAREVWPDRDRVDIWPEISTITDQSWVGNSKFGNFPNPTPSPEVSIAQTRSWRPPLQHGDAKFTAPSPMRRDVIRQEAIQDRPRGNGTCQEREVT